jgi:hypothetical protein
MPNDLSSDRPGRSIWLNLTQQNGANPSSQDNTNQRGMPEFLVSSLPVKLQKRLSRQWGDERQGSIGVWGRRPQRVEGGALAFR